MDELESILKENRRLYLEFRRDKFLLRELSVNGIKWVKAIGATIEEVVADYKEKHRTMV